MHRGQGPHTLQPSMGLWVWGAGGAGDTELPAERAVTQR